jgi:putative hydrolase of the HAD superfamily
MPPPTHVFFDIGGVLGTNGWDTEQRMNAAAQFGLDGEFDARHREIAGDWELGRLTVDEYLDIAVFYEPRPFSREAFYAWMKDQSRPFEESVRLARRVAERGHASLFTLNNESAELNQHRIEKFGLADIFDAFFSSCWLGVRKPTPRIYTVALAATQASPAQSLLIDDRAQNLGPAAARGMRTILYRNPAQLEEALVHEGLL